MVENPEPKFNKGGIVKKSEAQKAIDNSTESELARVFTEPHNWFLTLGRIKSPVLPNDDDGLWLPIAIHDPSVLEKHNHRMVQFGAWIIGSSLPFGRAETRPDGEPGAGIWEVVL